MPLGYKRCKPCDGAGHRQHPRAFKAVICWDCGGRGTVRTMDTSTPEGFKEWTFWTEVERDYYTDAPQGRDTEIC